VTFLGFLSGKRVLGEEGLLLTETSKADASRGRRTLHEETKVPGDGEAGFFRRPPGFWQEWTE